MKQIKKKFARSLRKDQTKTEKVIWELLRKRKFMGLKFRRQHVNEIAKDKKMILNKIKKAIVNPPTPSPSGRGM